MLEVRVAVITMHEWAVAVFGRVPSILNHAFEPASGCANDEARYGRCICQHASEKYMMPRQDFCHRCLSAHGFIHSRAVHPR